MRRAIVVLGLCGCAEFLDIPDEPREVARGPWRCLDESFERIGGDVLPSTPASQGEPTARVSVRACDFVSGCMQPVTGLSARLCNKRDVGCTNPRQEGLRDVDGELSLRVPSSGSGFDGYLKVDAPLAPCNEDSAFPDTGGALCALVPDCDRASADARCLIPTYAPALLFFNPPIVADVPAPIPLQLLPSPALPAVVEAAGADLDPTTGNLFITALDCDGRPAAGVTYAIAQHRDRVTALYVDSGVVSDTVFETDDSGIGGFVGVPPGFVQVTGYAPDGTAIGEIGLQAAPFTLTYSTMAPGR